MNKLKTIFLAVIFMVSAGAMATPDDLFDPNAYTTPPKTKWNQIICTDYFLLDYYIEKCGLRIGDDDIMHLVSDGLEIKIPF